MAAVSSATLGVIARLSAPVINDIYRATKGAVKNSFEHWQEAGFPKRIAKKIGSISLVKTLWRPDDDVSLLKFYHPPRIKTLEAREGKHVNRVTDIDEGNIVIEGIVGQGKSIFLRWLAIQEAKNEINTRIPVFIELRTLHKNYLLRDAIFQILESYEVKICANSFDHLAKSGKLVLLLDAFDELDESLIRKTLNEITFLAKKYESMQIIVSSRPGNEIQKISGFKRVKICELRRDEYTKFLFKMGISAVKNAEIVEAIKDSVSGVSNLITTPLMLTLVVIVYEFEKEIPPTLPDFFERLFQIVLTKHDRLKDGFNRKRHSGLSDRKLQDLFEAFCFMALQNGHGRSLTGEQFTEVYQQAVEYIDNCNCDQEKFQTDITKGACLMLEEGVDTSTFLHKSLMEYYAAAFIKHSTDEVAKMFYEAAGDNIKIWREVVKFLSSIDPYRYSKDFALPQITALLTKHNDLLVGKNEKALIGYMDSSDISEGFGYVQTSGRDSYHVGFWGFSYHAEYFEEELLSAIIHATFQSLPDTPDHNKVERILGVKIEADVQEVRVSSRRVIEYAGSQRFWEAIEIFRLYLDGLQRDAERTINQNNKRKNIFLPKKQ